MNFSFIETIQIFLIFFDTLSLITGEKKREFEFHGKILLILMIDLIYFQILCKLNVW
jgi:hypothetical protein